MSQERKKHGVTRLCGECGEPVINEGAHAEACSGPVGFEQVEFQCGRCLRTEPKSVWCHGMWMSRVNPGAYRRPSPRPL